MSNDDDIDIGKLAREHDLKVAKAQQRKKRNGVVTRPGDSGYPYNSEAMAVDREDVGKAQEILKAHGVSTDYTRSGEPIITSSEHRRRHAQAMGFYDRNGTWSPKNR
jgi:hypothetical protein